LAVLNETVNAVSEAKYLFVEEYTVYVVMVTAMTGRPGPTVEALIRVCPSREVPS